MFGNLIKIVGLGDKRKDRRVAVRLPAAFGDVRGRLTDIGLGGCGFYPDRAKLEVGDCGTMHIRVTDETILPLQVEIVSMDEEGMIYSVAFTDLDDRSFQLIENVITLRFTADREKERTPHLPMPRSFTAQTRAVPVSASL